MLAARISLTLSRHSSLSFIALGRSSGQQPVSSHFKFDLLSQPPFYCSDKTYLPKYIAMTEQNDRDFKHILLNSNRGIPLTTLFCSKSYIAELRDALLSRIHSKQYDTKQSDGNTRVILELREIRSAPSLTSLPGPLGPRVIAPLRVLFIDKIELNCVLMPNWIACKRTVLTFKLRTYTILNYLK